MGHRARVAPGGYVYHVRSRSPGGRVLFPADGDFAAFEAILCEATGLGRARLLAYVLMPDHWHLVVRPEGDGDLSRYIHWVKLAHTHRPGDRKAGPAPVYRPRFQSFPVQRGSPLWFVGRYVERNPVRAGLVTAAADWRWSSLWHEVRGRPAWLSEWPGHRPPLFLWQAWVNSPEPQARLAALRRCAERGSPYGDPAWVAMTAERLGLQSTLRPRGRPRKKPAPPAAGEQARKPIDRGELLSAEEWYQRMVARRSAQPDESGENPG